MDLERRQPSGAHDVQNPLLRLRHRRSSLSALSWAALRWTALMTPSADSESFTESWKKPSGTISMQSHIDLSD